MNIVFAINKTYIQHFLVALKSIEKNRKIDEEFKIHILYIDLLESDKDLIKEEFSNLTLKFYDLSYFDFSQFFISGHINYETYLRIIAPTIINEDKVLYLDSDLIVRDSLKELYSTDITNFAIAAVSDPIGQIRKGELGIPDQFSYFNAGVLLMNLDYWRREKLSEILINYIYEMKNKLQYWDQDALNAKLYNQVVLLDAKWNIQTQSFCSDSIEIDSLNNPYIIHFTGASKPWHISCENPFKDEYLEYLSLTTYKNYSVISNSAINVIKNKRKIYLWGAGTTGKKVKKYLNNIKIEGFIDSDRQKFGKFFEGELIYSINEIEKSSDVGILICSGYYKEITSVLKSYGYIEGVDFAHQM